MIFVLYGGMLRVLCCMVGCCELCALWWNDVSFVLYGGMM